ncbi:MAG: proprotein convertase P-domain-containing protein [Chloracidobacterium sp.]|nr:proprotein convertase P-domain-containing protein [Chloracidobacterium sp.]
MSRHPSRSAISRYKTIALITALALAGYIIALPLSAPSSTSALTDPPTATTTATAPCGGGSSVFSYTGPDVAIPDNLGAGVNFTIPVSFGTLSDLNFRFDGTQSDDPTSTTPGINHSFIGDLIVKITSPGGTTVSVFDRPGFPATTFGCASNNLAQIMLDGDGSFPPVENECATDSTAFPIGTFEPNNQISAFDGQNATGNWTINISDNNAGDTGTARAFSLLFQNPNNCGPSGTPTNTHTPTLTPTFTPTNTPTSTPTVIPSPLPEYDLLISQSAAPNPVVPGMSVTYTLVVSNVPMAIGGGACPNVRFGFPTGVPYEFVLANGTNGYVPTSDAGGVTFTGGCVSSQGGTTGTATLQVRVRITGSFTQGVLTSLGSNVIVDPENNWNESNETNNTAETVQTQVWNKFTPTATWTPTFTATSTNTPTFTPTFMPTPTFSPTACSNVSMADGNCGVTPTSTSTATLTPTASPSPTFTATATAVPSPCIPGNLDSTFNGYGTVTTSVGTRDVGRSVAIQPDNKIVVAGQSNRTAAYDFGLVRYNQDGSLDTSFNGTGTVTTIFPGDRAIANSIALQADGKIVAAGEYSPSSTWGFALARYNTDGTLDTSFGANGRVVTPIDTQATANAVAVQSDGKIVAAGGSGNVFDYRVTVVRYNTDGTIDTTFGGTGIVRPQTGSAQAISIQSDGKIIIAGHTTDFALIRYNADGTLDTSFGGTGIVSTTVGGSSASVAIQPNGRIVAAGETYNGTNYDYALVRYKTDGSLDTSFNGTGIVKTPVGPSHDWANSVAIQSDGKIVAAGKSYSAAVGQDTGFSLVRYNADGSLDSTFDGDGKLISLIGSSSYANDVAIQSDGKLVLAGADVITPYGGRFVVARYWADTCATSTPTFTPTPTFTATPSNATVQFSSATYNAHESLPAVITIARTGDLSGTNFVFFSTLSGGTATGGVACNGFNDYITVSQQPVIFGPGDATATVNVTTCPDTATKGGETVNLGLSASNTTLGTPSVAVLTIFDPATPTNTSTATVTPTPMVVVCPPAFSNAAPITINDNAPGAPYPSNIMVSGLSGTVTGVKVDLLNMNHTFPDDVDILLVGPDGQSTLLMSDAGLGFDIVRANLTFDDAAATTLQDTTQIIGGSYKPTNFDTTTDIFPTPAPTPGTTVGMSVFNGSNPNGTWSLYVRDDLGVDTGIVGAGWQLHITTSDCSTPTGTPTPTNTATNTPTARVTDTPGGFPSVYFNSATYSESEPQTAVITINRAGNPSIGAGANFSTSDDTAIGGPACTVGVDFINFSQQVSFGPNEFTKTVNVQLCPDSLTEPTETVKLTLTGNYVNYSGTAVLNIINTATPTATVTPTGTPASVVGFSSAAYFEDESQAAVITLNRTGDLSGTATVNFSTSDGMARGGSVCSSFGGGPDYLTVTNQTVTFNPNETVKTVNVALCGDGIAGEFNETVNLSLSGSNAGSQSTAVLTINDTATRYENLSNIAINGGAAASLYPSTITVASIFYPLGSMRVTIYDYSTDLPNNVDFLMVGPGGQKFVLLANAGGLTSGGPATLTFSDTAGQIVPANGPLTTGDLEPTSYGSVTDFPGRAPAGPYNLPGSTIGGFGSQMMGGNPAGTYAGADPNGVWSLYVRDRTTSLFHPGSVVGNIGGWGLEFTMPTSAQGSISGRVLSADGHGLRNTKVVVTGNSLSQPIVATTGSMGYFSFDELTIGEIYVVTVNARRYTFSTPSRVITLTDNVVDADFIAEPQE